jgi:hypothetical protein
MKNYEVKIQEDNNLCLCSVLQTILRNRQIYFGQREIARCLTPSEKGYYADDQRIKIFLLQNKFEYSYYKYNATPFNEPDMLLKEMNENEGFIGVNNHVYLLNEFKDPLLEMIDPLNVNFIHENLYDLMGKMKKDFGFFGLLKYIG